MTHEERLELIHRPFFIINIGHCYPWGGCAVTDNFFDTDGWAARSLPTSEGKSSLSAAGSALNARVTLFATSDIKYFEFAHGNSAAERSVE